jgi:alkyl sulfatase BDS1-like metallo-beta-lactamase superfamily hydrolase
MKEKEMSRERSMLTLMMLFAIVAPASPGGQTATNPADLQRVGDRVIKINEAISMVAGFGNTFVVATSEGNVVIDTSSAPHAPIHKRLLTAGLKGPVKYIILTHGHGDHTGGIPLWREDGTQVIAQRNFAEFMHYQTRLAGFFAVRNSAQFGRNIPPPARWAGNYGARIEPTVLFDDKYEFTLGGVTFEIHRTPGETPDHLTVWVPKYRAAFIGDNYYESFPNIYTLRGTPPRWALDYVASLNKVMSLEPELALPSHGPAISGAAAVRKQLTKYRDAIQYVHDETVKGMNAGKDVFTLMREIKLPSELQMGETYGTVAWTVRGIYDGYVGWFDGNPSTMYHHPQSSIYPDIVKLAGGADAIANLASERIQKGDAIEALHLTDVALAADGQHRKSLEARLKALTILRDRCRNSNERGWLDYGIRQTEARLSAK